MSLAFQLARKEDMGGTTTKHSVSQLLLNVAGSNVLDAAQEKLVDLQILLPNEGLKCTTF
jgi:hypothetical protein